MTCPECSGELCVDRTIKTTKMDVRHRRCLGCGVRWESTETLTKGSRKGAANSSPVAAPEHSQPPPVAFPALSGRIPSAKGVGVSVSGISDRQGDQGDTDHQTEVQATASAGATPAQAILRAVPLPPSEKPKKKSAAPGEEPPYSNAFKAWYSIYPRKVSKPDAWKAWNSEGCAAIPAVVIAGTRLHLPEFASRPPDKVLYPATFLRRRVWEDAPLASQSAVTHPATPAGSLLDLSLADQEKIAADRKVNGYKEPEYYLKMLGYKS